MVVDMALPDREYDILILGGGILGVFCAYYATLKWPDKRVAIVEKHLIGKGVTAYSAYLEFPYGATSYKQNLTRRSGILFDELLEEFPNLPMAMSPFIGISSGSRSREVIGNLVMPGWHLGKPYEFHKQVPDSFRLKPESIFFHGLRGRYAYNDITYALAMEVIKKGRLTIYEGIEAMSIEEESERYTVHTNFGLTLRSDAIIDATGPWMLKGFSASYISHRKPRIKKIVTFHIDDSPSSHAPIIYFFDDDAFLLPQIHLSRWLFSYRCEEWDMDINNDRFTITAANLSDALKVLRSYNFTLCDKVAGGRAFCDLYSDNGDPIVESPKSGYVIVGAPGGSGFRLAPALAEEVIGRLY